VAFVVLGLPRGGLDRIGAQDCTFVKGFSPSGTGALLGYARVSKEGLFVSDGMVLDFGVVWTSNTNRPKH